MIKDTPPAPAEAPSESASGAIRVPIEKVHKSPWQPRKKMAPEALEDLTHSIRERGVLQPLLVRKVEDRYELIAGERRFRASQAAGLKDVPVILMDVSDREALELALIENLQRADLDLIEEAEGYRDLMREAGLTQEEVSKRIGKARATIANALRLLDLSDAIKRAIAEGALTPGHAKVLLGVEAKDRDLLAARVVAQGLSVRALEKLVAGLGRPQGGAKAAAPEKSGGAVEEKTARQLKHLADRMQQELGTKVALAPARQLADGKREMGRIVIEFFDNEDLSRLLEMLNLGDLA